MDAAVEQTIGFNGRVLCWELPANINKLCHRCGKLGCAPNWCPLCSSRGHSRQHDPVARLRECFHLYPFKAPARPASAQSRSRTRSHSRSQSCQAAPSGSLPGSQLPDSSHRPKSKVQPSAPTSTIPRTPASRSHPTKASSTTCPKRSVSFSANNHIPAPSPAAVHDPSATL